MGDTVISKRQRRGTTAPWRAVLAALALVGTTLAGAPPAFAAPGDAPVTGSFFVDLDRDGTIDTGEELANTDPLLPPGGITVTAYDAAGGSATGVVAPGLPLTFSIDVSALAGQDYRLEFSVSAADATAGWTPTVFGADSPSDVQFASAGDDVSFGVVPPSSCRDGDGALFLACFTLRDLTDAVVTMDYDTANKTVNGLEGQTGSVWGAAYDEWTDRLWVSAVGRRGYDLGPEGYAGLYRQDAGTGGWTGFDLGAAAFIGAFNPNTATPEDFASVVGRIGIGDIDVSPNGRTLFVTNLLAKSVHIYDVTTGTPVPTIVVPVPNPGCAAGDDYEIFATKSISNTAAYVGAVCTAEVTNDVNNLTAHVFEVDTAGGAAAVPGLATIPLNYERGCTAVAAGCNRFFEPWTDSAAYLLAQRIVVDGARVNNVRQPLLSDIEIGPEGDVILGFTDRTALQQTSGQLWDDSSAGANEAVFFNITSGGDLLRYENTGTVENPTLVPDPAISTGGGAEHFGWDSAPGNPAPHEEISSGSAYVHQLSPSLEISLPVLRS